MGFKFNQKAVGYPHNVYTTIAPMNIYCPLSIIVVHSLVVDDLVYQASCTATSDTMKATQYGGSFLVNYQLDFFHGLRPKCVLSATIGSYHKVLVDNQES